MINVRILLSIEPQLSRQILLHALDRYSDIEVVGQTSDVIETLALIAQYKPTVLIHSWEESSDYRTFLSHVHEIAPDLVIVNFSLENPCGYMHVPLNSIDSLLTHICRIAESTESVYSSHR